MAHTQKPELAEPTFVATNTMDFFFKLAHLFQFGQIERK